MKPKKLILLVLVTAVLLVTMLYMFDFFRPLSKEAYIERYKVFIEEVSNDRDSYTDDDWKDADEQFEKLNVEWYNNFEDQLSWNEQLTLTKYGAKYRLYRYSPF